MGIDTLRFPRNKQMEQIFDDKATGADGPDVSEKVSAVDTHLVNKQTRIAVAGFFPIFQ